MTTWPAGRIEQAKRLLVTTDWPFRQVAKRCGFCSVQHMSTRIRQVTGYTPPQYRRRFATPAPELARGCLAR